jgi:Protein of unknown function (DUF1566)
MNTLSRTRGLRAIALCSMALAAGPAAYAGFNDTGVSKQQCYPTGSNVLAACSTSALAAQDGATGRDAATATNSKADGLLGFSFRKVCNSGSVAGFGNCPTKPKFGSSAKRWGCTRDEVTGLTWEVKTATGPRGADRLFSRYSAAFDPNGEFGSSTDAAGYVAEINAAGLCGANDWRLPTALELQSLSAMGGVVFAGGDGLIAIDTTWFPNTIEDAFWAEEDFVLNVTNAWVVETFSGRTVNHSRSEPSSVRLVRGPKLNDVAMRYEISLDQQEAADFLAGVIWRRCVEGQTWVAGQCTGTALLLSHEQALQRAMDQATATGSAWRVPNGKELASLATFSTKQPAINAATFPNTRSEGHWTSTPGVFSSGPSTAWQVDFFQGYLQQRGRTALSPVRLLRPLN